MRLDNQDRSGIEKAGIEGTDDLCLRHLEGLGVAVEVAVIERYYTRTAVQGGSKLSGRQIAWRRSDGCASAGPGAHDWRGRSLVVGRR